MKKKFCTISIQHNNGEELFHGAVNELPINEEYILSKSLELFNEKEPCIIHRTYISKKFYIDTYEKISTLRESGKDWINAAEIIDLLRNVDLDTKGVTIFLE